MTQSFEEYVTRARYSEQTERYEDMAEVGLKIIILLVIPPHHTRTFTPTVAG